MLRRTWSSTTKPPPWAQVDLTHPLGAHCQLACLFNDGSGTPHIPDANFANDFDDAPSVQYYQTLGNRTPLLFGPTTPPVWTYNSHGKALYCGATFSGVDLGFIYQKESYDLDYPEGVRDAVISRGQTCLIIRRKVDTTARASTLFGTEDDGSFPAGHRCGAHVPYSDGTVYWDYGGNGGNNRLTVSGLTFTTLVEKWAFLAGPQGSSIWRDGIKLASQATALTRIVNTSTGNNGGWVINGGNGLAVNGGGDLQEYNFVMHLATQWSDDMVRWWSAEPYAAFYLPFAQRNYYFVGVAPPATADQLVIAPQAAMPRGPWVPVAY